MRSLVFTIGSQQKFFSDIIINSIPWGYHKESCVNVEIQKASGLTGKLNISIAFSIRLISSCQKLILDLYVNHRQKVLYILITIKIPVEHC